MIRNFFFSVGLAAFIVVPLSACSNKKDETAKPVPGLYDTRFEAQRAAKEFGCTGAHRMGNKWMPCSKHGSN